MQNQKSKSETDLKHRSYQYSIKMIGFLETLAKDTSNKIITKQI